MAKVQPIPKPDITPLAVGDVVIYSGSTPMPQAALVTGLRESNLIDLTAFPPGVPPVALTGVGYDPDGKPYSWRRKP